MNKYKLSPDRKEYIIHVANAGKLIGHHAVLSEDPYPDSAAALEESMITLIPAGSFLETLRQSDKLNKRLLKTLSLEFAGTCKQSFNFCSKMCKRTPGFATHCRTGEV